MSEDTTAVRIDKWLWAARLFKTRSLAKDAVESGKVLVQGQRVKPSKNLSLGMLLQVRQGFEEKTLQITGLSDQRRGAPEAALLYQETPDSQARRAAAKTARQLQGPAPSYDDGKPNKKQRRQIHRFLLGDCD
jgi:ribosome-associated heat shock protein Hsp15